MVEKSLENPQLLRLKFYQETKGEYEYENYLDLVTFIFGSRFSFQHKCDLWLGWGNLEYIPPDPLHLYKPEGGEVEYEVLKWIYQKGFIVTICLTN